MAWAVLVVIEAEIATLHSASCSCRDQVSFRIATENGHFVAPTTCASHHTGVPGPSAAYSAGNTYPALMPLWKMID
ncbi:hypothetical protein CJ030_MR5G013410 [Morella rubra]|uniref:Uncharacterized protein n=1 Tax=Morella rubra TaxID=262757 RepID=A0A6A1VRH7_9ROSI|nr:hypothetical protein CJ030_MR5G013410 [Morella rubra]